MNSMNKGQRRYIESPYVRDSCRIKSSHITLDTSKQKIYDINLIYQYFIPKTEERVKEIKETLRRNVLNNHISKIYLLNERNYSDKELGIKSDKIIQIIIGKWITFKDVFTFVEKEHINGYIIMANSDIFFDNTVSNLHYTDLDSSQKIISLLRWEYRGEKNLNECNIFGPRWDSQDTWIFHNNFNILKKYRHFFDFPFGQPGCDNKIIYCLLMLGFALNNDPCMFKTYHYHMEIGRNYSKQPLPSPYGFIIPEGVNFEKNNPFYDYKYMIQWTQQFSKWNFVDDNKLIMKLCQLHLSIKKPILILDALNVNNMKDKNKKYFEACSGYFICESYSLKIPNYQYFYQNSDTIKKQLLWYKLQNTLNNSYNTSNNWMNVYKDNRVLFITQDTVKQEILYKNKDEHYNSVFNNKEQQFINWKYTISKFLANTTDENNMNELIKRIEKIRECVDVVYIDIHSNVNNKIAYTIWHKLKLSCIILSITY